MLFKNFSWSLIDLQSSVSFRGTAKWITYMCTHTLGEEELIFFFFLFFILPPSRILKKKLHHLHIWTCGLKSISTCHFKELCYQLFQLQSTRSFFKRLFSPIGHYRVLSGFLFVVYFMYSSVYMSILISYFTPLPPPEFVFCICDSVSALHVRFICTFLFLKITHISNHVIFVFCVDLPHSVW